MSQVLTMPSVLGDLLKREFDPNYNRERITLKAGTDYAVGSVLGKVSATGVYVLSPNQSITGSEGAELACAVLLEAVDATQAEMQALAVVRGPVILAEHKLTFDVSVSAADHQLIKHQQLAAFGLVVAHTA